MTDISRDVDRRSYNLSTSKVKELLPEYFVSEYPALVMFLEKYYEFLESDTSGDFKSQINELVSIRDIPQTSLENLDQIINEIGNGLQVGSFFQSPRLMARLLSTFYGGKGSLVSAEGFFRAFFNEEATIEYPKDQIFIVGESLIGYESLKFIQDARTFQIFSILVKVGLSVTDYQFPYNKFVHPAGWHFQGQVVTSGFAELDVTAQGQDSLDSDGGIVYANEAIVDATAGFHELTGLYQVTDENADEIRINVDKDLIAKYQDLTIEEMDDYYATFEYALTPNSFTFDDGIQLQDLAKPDTAMTLETMDNAMFKQYATGFEIIDEPGGPNVYVSEVVVNATTGFDELTILYDSEGTNIRVRSTEHWSWFDTHGDLTFEQFETYYDTLAQAVSPNSFTFDDSDNIRRPDTAMTLEYTSNTMFTRYLSDSAI